jgi:LysR family transcriptional regulator (chromosome initiation inhibitor)
MILLDYDLLATLAIVIREGSFERAAERLHISQSAVSQRIKLLEGRMGTTVVVRGRPCIGTSAGNQLCAHVERVALLEHGLEGLLHTTFDDAPVPQKTLPIAVNADSIATWFPEVIAEATNRLGLLLELIPDDQEHTFEMLTSGKALAAVSGDVPAINGFGKKFLGNLNYTAVCNPEYRERYFEGGVDRNALLGATCIVFDRKDTIPDQWLLAYNLSCRDLPINWIPSFTGYIASALAGAGWGVVPKISIMNAIKEGQLVELVPTAMTSVPLFWMTSTNSCGVMKNFSKLVTACARKHLDPRRAEHMLDDGCS